MVKVTAHHTRPYQKLIVWQEAHALCLFTYKTTKTFPSEERFALGDQMRRSSSSVPTNIAEGSIKSSKKDRSRMYELAATSLEELHYQYVLARDLGYIDKEQLTYVDDKIQRISYLLTKLRSSRT